MKTICQIALSPGVRSPALARTNLTARQDEILAAVANGIAPVWMRSPVPFWVFRWQKLKARC
ncbi:MAG TPA: hypothetical protein VMV89_10190 [Candidatus Paceibacterota bacterium]|nr:hypothetical protein [Candidatus Paceibacterota bacterium]